MPPPRARRAHHVRSGSTQDGRRRAELAVDHFLPDERDLADLVLFGQRFARHVRFFDASNAPAGDWSAFFEGDVTAALASLARLPIEALRGFQVDLEAWLKADPARDEEALAAHAKLLFHLPLALLEAVADHHARLRADDDLSSTITELVARDMASPLRGLIGWYKGATIGLGQGNGVFDDTAIAAGDYNLSGGSGDPRLRLSDTVARALLDRPPLSQARLPTSILVAVPPGNWADLYASTPEDLGPYLDAVGAAHQRYQQIRDALDDNLLTAAVEHLYQGLERIRRDAATRLEASLDGFAHHAPHMGLWLAFLRLFEHAQGELNAFTGRHLDFYFREVLRLTSRPAVPDEVHVLFELARGRRAQRLVAGTRLRAGTDAHGAPLAYALGHDIVVNRASVARLHGVRIEAVGDPAARGLLPRAASEVRSRDGDGEVELGADDPSWSPFGPAEGPVARIGFAVADRKLFLREGRRVIVLRVECSQALPRAATVPRWRVRLTGAEGWFALADHARVETRFIRVSSATEPMRPPRARLPRRPLDVIEIVVTLEAEDPPIVPLDVALHGDAHAPGLPVLELALDFAAAATPRAFAGLRDMRVDRVTLRVEASGLRDLFVSADGAIVDATTPFAPFGPRPRAGASWIVGSSEVFSKPIAAWRIEVDWATPYVRAEAFLDEPASAYDASEAVLSGARWLAQAGNTRSAAPSGPRVRTARAPAATSLRLGRTNATIEMRGAAAIDALAEQTLVNPALSATSVTGFARLQLRRGFGHADFVREQTRALIGLAGGTPYVASGGVNTVAPPGGGMPLPCEPYDPVVTRLEAAYESEAGPVAAFAHLHPFGVSHGTPDGRLFPSLPFEAALHIGIADLEVPARLALLVQVADGSGDPLTRAPELEFAVLAGDAWLPLAARDVDDGTRNFTRSGILGLALPESADTDHRSLPAGLHWLRVAVARAATASNRLLSITAQAARASAVADATAVLPQAPLPAGTIAKLVNPEPAIKTITQPYPSFGGRRPESADDFARRVSERLRHKDRAVTMFDYEALVLEAFPNLYRAKCLATTELRRDPRGGVVADDELRPGAVTVVTVPWAHGRDAHDVLRPYTDRATLDAVDAFLRTRISPFVRLEVQNPKFEEAHVECAVRFRPGTGDVAFYLAELDDALVGYLTPWSQPDGHEITFGGRLWKSSIIAFLEDHPSVDFIADVRLYHKVDVAAPPGAWSPIDMEVIEATTARSILVSAAHHTIREVPAHA